MDGFVKTQLLQCDCGHVENVFLENEIDERTFRKLNKSDLQILLPGKMGLQIRILEQIEKLQSNGNLQTNGAERPAPAPVHELKSSPTIGVLNNSQISARFNLIVNPYDTLGRLNISEPASRPEPSAGIQSEVSRSSSKSKAAPVRRIVSSRLSSHRSRLPVHALKDPFLKIVKENTVVIVKGETGSGKSTQLTQYLLEAGYGVYGKIACTQPRRIAAKSLAKRVSEECGDELGGVVGYRVRFENRTTATTEIVYMTDGVLLREFATDPNIYPYSVIILDEAHERSLNTDMLLGILKSSIKRRPDLRVLITSATLDCSKFAKYFDDAPIFIIPGRTYPVEIEYSYSPSPDYANACINTVWKIHQSEKEGDILVFLGGQDEIERTCDILLYQDTKHELWILPCYASLSVEEQSKVFEPTPKEYKRKVIVATNIAETSITIDGVVYVVDSGIVKQSDFDPFIRQTTLRAVMISKAQADQRSGRAGRTKPGKAFRLYSKEDFERMLPNPTPDIQRSNLEQTILLLASHGIEDIHGFDFIDRPKPEAIESSITELTDLQALHCGQLTKIGRSISHFPLEPKLAKILITSVELNCTNDILTIVSMLTVQSSMGKIFFRPKKRQVQADRAKAEFFKPQGDHLTLLNVFQKWEANGYSERWCRDNFINYRAINESIVIREHLEAIMKSIDLTPSPTALNIADPEAVQKTFASGYFSQIALKTKGYGYMTYANPNEKELVYIHPGSVLAKSIPNWLLYEEQMNTGNKSFLLNVIAIEPRWIEDYAPTFYKKLQMAFPQLQSVYRMNRVFVNNF